MEQNKIGNNPKNREETANTGAGIEKIPANELNRIKNVIAIMSGKGEWANPL